MLILQRMATTSSSLLSSPLLKPSSFLSPLKRCVSQPTSDFRAFAFSRNGLSTSAAAVAATEPHVSTQHDKLKEAQKEKTDKLDRVVLPSNESSEKLLRIRHTCAHVMAMAVQKLYPDAKVTIGPWIENGFYYDFDMEPLTDKELKRIKKEMDRIICRNLPLVREEVSREEAQRRISALNEPYKLEILDSIKEDPITIYHIGNEWWDLCAGPHVEYTGKINRKAVELESIAGAYWRGDEKKPMLQRIYGTAWENEEQLQAYLHFKEEAKRRDHRRLGQVLDLFSIQNDAGGGLVFWHPKGAIVRHVIEDLWKKTHIERGYDLLYTPHVAKADLWQISGHLDFYRENMYNQMDVEDELYQLRPMNCPYHILIYKRRRHSYNDFPIRVAELGTVYRYELSGSLHGLFRVRGFTQDDAHIFCLEDQIKDEIRGVLDLTEELLLKFGFSKYEVNLSTRPEKSVGDDDIWEKATSALRDALEDKGWSYQIDDGGGAFYGPKIDLKIEDALGRKWQCSTIQVDFNLPQRFDITYIDSNSEKKRPIMIHRAVLGSLERFFGVLIEHYAGDFPLWLSPVQAHVLPVTDTQLDYCKELTNKLKANGIRGELCHGERLPKLIRNSEMLKIPIMAVVGAKEVESGTVTVRSRSGDDPGTMSIDDFVRTCVLFLVAFSLTANAADFDVRIYGAKADDKTGDSQAINKAWTDACAATSPSTVVIEKGNYLVGQVRFGGPCKAPISIKVAGTLVAPAEPEKLKSQDGWVNIPITGVTNSHIQDITSFNSKLFHINVINSKHLTLQRITIDAPQESLNTDGIHIGRSSFINVTDANIKTGDDCVSLGDGSQNINVEKVTCGSGHGISIGSLGRYHDEQPVQGVTVRYCQISNTTNGVRIKTWPASPNGVASDLHFEDISMDNVKTNPVLIDQEYCPYGQCQAKLPSKVKISNVSFKNIRGTTQDLVAVKLVCSRGIPCQNVQVTDINLTYNGNKNGTATSECVNVKPTVSGFNHPQVCAKNVAQVR
ncbi:hypothetical protein ACLB2K_067376 [Fragaria x ananassa]